MQYKIDDNKLIIDGKVVYEAPCEICDTLVGDFNREAVVLIYWAYDLVPDKEMPEVYRRADDPKLQEAINQNVLCIDKEGNVIWRIESTSDLPIFHARFTNKGPNYKNIWVYRNDAREFRIDSQSGKVLEQRMGL